MHSKCTMYNKVHNNKNIALFKICTMDLIMFLTSLIFIQKYRAVEYNEHLHVSYMMLVVEVGETYIFRDFCGEYVFGITYFISPIRYVFIKI